MLLEPESFDDYPGKRGWSKAVAPMKIFGRNARSLRVQSLPVNDRFYISATTSELRGIPGVEPVLRLTFNVEAGGLADGAFALFLATANIESSPGRVLSLGTAIYGSGPVDDEAAPANPGMGALCGFPDARDGS